MTCCYKCGLDYHSQHASRAAGESDAKSPAHPVDEPSIQAMDYTACVRRSARVHRSVLYFRLTEAEEPSATRAHGSGSMPESFDLR